MICPICLEPFEGDRRAKSCRGCRPEYIRRKARQYAQDIKAGVRVRLKTYEKLPRQTRFGVKTDIKAKCPKCEGIHVVEWFGSVPAYQPRVFCKSCAWCRHEGIRNETYRLRYY